MPDPHFPDYSRLVPTGPLPDREQDLTHMAQAESPAPETVLHLAGEPEETACGIPRGQLKVTNHRNIFVEARAGRLAAYRHVCDACFAQVEGTGGGAYRSRG